MKAIWALALSFVLLTSFALESRAQGTFHDTSFSQPQDSRPVMGSDFWFAPPALAAIGGEYYELNITSPKTTIAHIQVGTMISSVAVTAGKTATFSLPLTQVIKTSSIVESKGYHVWSDSAPLDVMLLADYTTDSAGDAMHILPDFQLGKNYVVASYEAYFIGPGSDEFDYPSMFTVTAPHDSTYVQITPSADLRMETETNPNPTAVAHRTGLPFTVELDRGESVQFKTVVPLNATDYDLTGTVIRANHPVAVIGASQRAAVPSDHTAHPDYLADMLPPVRTWDTLYYSMPFYQPTGVKGHDASSFAVIGTIPNQAIYCSDATGDHLFALLDHAYDALIQPDRELPSLWHSSAPFLLAQYGNASDYPTYDPGVLGSPRMMIVPGASRFGRTLSVQVPISSGTFSTQFSPFINVITNSAATEITLDGTSIRSWPKSTLPDGTIIYRNSAGGLARARIFWHRTHRSAPRFMHTLCTPERALRIRRRTRSLRRPIAIPQCHRLCGAKAEPAPPPGLAMSRQASRTLP